MRTMQSSAPINALTPSSNSGQQTHQRLRRLAGQAIADYSMIEANDKVMVCLRGKDSYGLLDIPCSSCRRIPGVVFARGVQSGSEASWLSGTCIAGLPDFIGR